MDIWPSLKTVVLVLLLVVFMANKGCQSTLCFIQLVWFTKELVRNAVTGADGVCHCLLRQISGSYTFYISMYSNLLYGFWHIFCWYMYLNS